MTFPTTLWCRAGAHPRHIRHSARTARRPTSRRNNARRQHPLLPLGLHLGLHLDLYLDVHLDHPLDLPVRRK